MARKTHTHTHIHTGEVVRAEGEKGAEKTGEREQAS